jgi:hypothetical protein
LKLEGKTHNRKNIHSIGYFGSRFEREASRRSSRLDISGCSTDET